MEPGRHDLLGLARLLALWLCVALAVGCEGAAGSSNDGPDGAVSGDAAVSGDTAGGDAVTPGPVVPELDPLTHDEAVAMAAAARRLVAVTADGEEYPVAWSMVNWCCQDRAYALMYAFATLDPTEGAPPPRMDMTTMTEAGILALAEQARRKTAAINLAGPLGLRQTLVLPDGTELPPNDGAHHDFYTWGYHHGAVLNVDGEPRVIDLSVGDEPLTPEQWLRGFVDPSVTCPHVSQEEFNEVLNYWISVGDNRIPGPRPERPCVYTITPIFTFDSSKQVATEPVLYCPDVMKSQTGAFVTLLGQRGATIPEEQIPHVTSLYEALSEAEQCELKPLYYCELL